MEGMPMAIHGFSFVRKDEGFLLYADRRLVLKHSAEKPLLAMGWGEAYISMHHGNFDIEDEIRELCPLTHWKMFSQDCVQLWSEGGRWVVELRLIVRDGRLVVKLSSVSGEEINREEINGARTGSDTISRDERLGKVLSDSSSKIACPTNNNAAENNMALRLRISLPSLPNEHIYGCGEQFSYFDLKGRKFPLWTSEQGVGRNKSSLITLQADAADHAGGDYWWTFYPQPSFVSSRGYWVHIETSAYSVFDFRRPLASEFLCWDVPTEIVFGQAESMPKVLEDLTAYYGRQPLLPLWVYNGVILGIQGGAAVCEEKLRKAQKAGVPVAGIWAQDWEGINTTSFGQRLRWNWVWDKERYPDLDTAIQRWRAENVRFLAYANCYVGKGFSLCEEAAVNGYLVKNRKGEDYYVDFGEFFAGIVDLTNPAAFSWYAQKLAENILGLGASGWMADFGEYLPTDAMLFDGTQALLAHNQWPVLWARCNAEAVRLAHAEDEALYFMRAGFTGSQRWCPIMWAGDQNVDWSNDDGLPSAVRSALSLAMSGHGLHHSDIGGYTTLFGLHRTKELFMRWVEQAAFSPLMRTHEGNRPRDNWQFDSDEETMAHLARMARVHKGLTEYLKACVAENATRGLPVMRPLFMHYPSDERAWSIDDEYLLGPDLLVAPIITEGAIKRAVHFPDDEWLDFWTSVQIWHAGTLGDAIIEAPLGKPLVFMRASSSWIDIFIRARE